jgi:hypothetical protein
VRKKYGALFALVLLTILPSCAALTTVPSGADFCEAAEIITWVDEDTPETRTLIREHNCVGAYLCDWPIKDCPKPK